MAFFLGGRGFMKDRVILPPLRNYLPELRHRLGKIFASVALDILAKMWEELKMRLDMCRYLKQHMLNILRKTKLVYLQFVV